MTPDEALREAAQPKLRPVYLLVGAETHLIAQVLAALRQAVCEGQTPGLSEDQFQAGEASVDTVLTAARTPPMFSRCRAVIVRGIERWEGREAAVEPAPSGGGGSAEPATKKLDPFEKLLEYAKNPTPSTILLLVGEGLDKRRRLVTTARNQGFLVACDAVSRAELPAWVERAVKARGHVLAPGVADLIAELAGPDLSPLADAVERLCLYVGAGQAITEDAVSTCVVRLRTATVWELLGAVGRRDLGVALATLQDVYDPQDRGLRLVGLLAWSTRQLLRFEAALRGGLPPGEAATKAGAPPFKARELTQQIKMISRAELEQWLVILASLDLALKGGSRRPPRAILEHGILRLIANKNRPSGRPSLASGP